MPVVTPATGTTKDKFMELRKVTGMFFTFPKVTVE
jgi:hypothetical protein